MLSDRRVMEAEQNVRSYLADGLLKKTRAEENVVKIFVRNAKESLLVAESISGISDLWVIVCSYYSMFYYANAALLSYGYKVGSKVVHKVTADAMIVYGRKHLKDVLIEEFEEVKDEALNIAGVRADEIASYLDFERNKRGLIQYKTLESDKQKKARTSLQRAKEFAKELEKVLLR